MIRTFVFFLMMILFTGIRSQSTGQFEIEFKDKKQTEYSLNQPENFLSERAINRRIKQGISIDSSDLPINPDYLKEISKISSLSILSESKWFNDVVVELKDTSILSKLRSLSMVKDVRRLPGSVEKSAQGKKEKFDFEEIQMTTSGSIGEYGSAFRQISMLNAEYLHLKGYRGENMRIAVIDAGFTNVWFSPHFNHLYADGRIISVYNFVDKNDSVYDHSTHGNRVLSTMASNIPNVMTGTAPKAEYLLLRSEDGASEYLLEEYFWTEAAEYADSAGSDLINSSLGYSTFDDSLQNHTHDDMDGKSTRVSRSARIAAKKGILVFNSAGNSGNNSWQKITAPGDVQEILTIGAVDSMAMLANFSSRGPTADGRIKPDVAAMGRLATIGLDDGTVALSNGTSFSSPIMAGAGACLWQANPGKSSKEIAEAIVKSADRYNFPDTNYGYGIPDFYLADAILKGNLNGREFGENSLKYFPNPFSSEFTIAMRLKSTQYTAIEMHNSFGQFVGKYKFNVEGNKTSLIYLDDELSGLQSGMYFMKIITNDFSKEVRIVKL